MSPPPKLKTVTVLLQEKKGEKKEYPVLLKAFLVSLDKVMSEAAAVTMLAAEPKTDILSTGSKLATGTSTPVAVSTTPTAVQSTGATPASQAGAISQKGGSPNVQPTTTPGN